MRRYVLWAIFWLLVLAAFVALLSTQSAHHINGMAQVLMYR